MDTKFRKYLILLVVSLAWSAASRPSRRDYRQFPSAPLTYAQYPSYNIREPNGPGTYAFGYEFEDQASGSSQFRDEERLANGTVRGSYGYIRPDGKLTVTSFWADDRGYNSATETYDQAVHPPPYEPPNEPSDPSIDDDSYEQPSLSPEEVEHILHDQKIDLHPNYNPINDPDVLDPNVAALLGGKQPHVFQSKDGKGRLSVQFVNNFIPSNYPVLTLQTQLPHQPIFPPQMQPPPDEDINDPVDHTDFVNDKFHDPIFDERQHFVRRKPNSNRYPMRRYPGSRYPATRRPVIRKTDKQKQNQYPEASTREALWFRDMIRSRRKEYLEKYSANYDSYTIPANYLVSP